MLGGVRVKARFRPNPSPHLLLGVSRIQEIAGASIDVGQGNHVVGVGTKSRLYVPPQRAFLRQSSIGNVGYQFRHSPPEPRLKEAPERKKQRLLRLALDQDHNPHAQDRPPSRPMLQS